MQRCSENVAAIATALAKAQTELTNVEKTMVGTINHNTYGKQNFRYAPLSGGLEIVRKTLGGHHIAIAQTTAIDQTHNIINLTTTLIHTSGEWISSEWPVCQLSETSAPRRMGAALTYARRYALFTMVGIAGEDDLDSTEAPSTPAVTAPAIATPPAPSKLFAATPEPEKNGRTEDVLFDELQAKIALQTSADELQAIAPKILKAKNSLPTEKARAVEDAFKGKLASFQVQEGPVDDPENGDSAKRSQSLISPTDPEKRTRRPRSDRGKPRKPNDRNKAKTVTAISEPVLDTDAATVTLARIDKSMLTNGEPRRHRDKGHLRFVASQPCLICARSPSDAHHLRFAQPRAMGRKTSDEFTVPLCRTHHRDNHRSGDERGWWARTTIDPLEVSKDLWSTSRGSNQNV